MTRTMKRSRFKAKLLRPADAESGASWAFIVLPKAVSDTLPRRGRTSVEGAINGHPFQAMLEPDGQLSHWLKVDQVLCQAAGVAIGDVVEVEVAPMTKEQEPNVPADFKMALAAAPEAKQVWDATTTVARIDWIHWIESAQQAKTREKRIKDACEMLAAGKKRVCCFDPSGFYSKSLSAPRAKE
jgi:hypothetical protein